MPARDGFHSTDQPGGTAKGQDTLLAWFSTGIPESSSSKTEYNDTQQDLTGFQEKSQKLDHAWLEALSFFC
jgi:hypothetical protein